MDKRILILAALGGVLLLAAPYLTSIEIPRPAPTPEDSTPAPKPDGVPRSKDCTSCDGSGYMSDGHQGEDCGACDRTGNGSAVDPLPDGIRPTPSPFVSPLEKTQQNPPPYYEDLQTAQASALAQNRLLLALVLSSQEEAPEFSVSYFSALEEAYESRTTESPVVVFLYPENLPPGLSVPKNYPYGYLLQYQKDPSDPGKRLVPRKLAQGPVSIESPLPPFLPQPK